MTALPAFAAVLEKRRATHQQQKSRQSMQPKFPRVDDDEEDWRGRRRVIPIARQENLENECENSPDSYAYALRKLEHLQQVIGKSQTRIRQLEQENADLKEINAELEVKLSLLSSGRTAKEQELQKEMDAIKHVVASLKQIIASKDANFEALDRDYELLENDQKRLMRMRTADAEMMVRLQTEVNQLQKEVEELRGLREIEDIRSKAVTELDRSPIHRELISELPPASPRHDINVHVAMRDNVRFGDDDTANSKNHIDLLTSTMTDQELRDKLSVLIREKEEKDRLARRAIPKGVNRAHALREQEELEEQISGLNRQIWKVRLEMKQRGIYS
jgi:chromosome segregation ATPase